MAAGEQRDERPLEQHVLAGDHAPDLVRGPLHHPIGVRAVSQRAEVPHIAHWVIAPFVPGLARGTGRAGGRPRDLFLTRPAKQRRLSVP